VVDPLDLSLVAEKHHTIQEPPSEPVIDHHRHSLLNPVITLNQKRLADSRAPSGLACLLPSERLEFERGSWESEEV
jgi:hypothetical protein